MSRIRFFTDEDVFRVVAPQLRAAGDDAISTPEANRLSESDESHLIWAASQGRAVISFNIPHFAKLHQQWMGRDAPHAGIILSKQWSEGLVIRALLRLANSLGADEMKNRLEYLSRW